MIYPRYHCVVTFYRKRKVLGTFCFYGTISELDAAIHKAKRYKEAGWWVIKKLELATCLLDYENKEDYK